ncbi:MAG: thioredoxin family protein [Candidatus Latescibacterota bacterium]
MSSRSVVGTLTAAAACLLAAAAWAGPQVGQPAPDFSLADAQGGLHALSQYRGRIVVLEWTNPDCPYVQRHYREGTMRVLAGAYPAQQVAWLAVNTTHYNTPAATQEWSRSQGLTYPTLIDSAGQVGRLYGATTTPNMFVIDPQGLLAYAGAVDDDPRGEKGPEARTNYVRQAIGALLASQPVSPAETRPYGCSVKYAK